MYRKYLSRAKRVVVLAMLFAFVFSTSPTLAWWSGWYTPNFSGSYSPSAYRHGQWDTYYNSRWLESFGSEMKWNQGRADGVRKYSRNNNWIWFCGYCKSYYTHDHTDASNKLHAYAYATNFPNPKLDTDDDNRNGLWEELEVVALDSNFPAVDTTYYYYSYFERKASGSGNLYETPQMSAQNGVSGEYDTYRYDSNQTLAYYTYGTASSGVNLVKERDGLEPVEGAVDGSYDNISAAGGLSIRVWPTTDSRIVNVGLEYSFETSDDLSAYTEWVRTVPMPALREAGVQRSLTVITFKQPVLQEDVNEVLGQTVSWSVDTVRAVYLDAQNPDSASNTWTLQTRVDEGVDYADALGELATDITANGLGQDLSLQPKGIIAMAVWVPLDFVDYLNRHELVYLADSSPSYLRLVASGSEKAMQVRGLGGRGKLLGDGVGSFVVPVFNDLYPELQYFHSVHSR